MVRSIRKFFTDESGALITTEWVFIATLLLICAVSVVSSRQEAFRRTKSPYDLSTTFDVNKVPLAPMPLPECNAR